MSAQKLSFLCLSLRSLPLLLAWFVSAFAFADGHLFTQRCSGSQLVEQIAGRLHHQAGEGEGVTAFQWTFTAFPWPSTAFHCIPLPFLGLPMPFTAFHCLSLTF